MDNLALVVEHFYPQHARVSLDVGHRYLTYDVVDVVYFAHGDKLVSITPYTYLPTLNIRTLL
jgi:hypothetical protein